MISSTVTIVFLFCCTFAIGYCEIRTNERNYKQWTVDENNDSHQPQERTFHRIRKLQRRMMLLCSLGIGGRNSPPAGSRQYEDDDDDDGYLGGQARFFFPSIQQIANLQVTTGGGQISEPDDGGDDGGDDGDDGDDGDEEDYANGYYGGGRPYNCDYLLGSGLALSHPVFLNGLTLAGAAPTNIRINQKRLKRRLDRHITKPVRQTMKSMNSWLHKLGL